MKYEFQSTGEVSAGKLTLDRREVFDLQIKRFEGKRVRISVELERSGRSNAQNRYFHGVIVQMISDHTGYEPEEVKAILKSMFLKAERDGREYVRETHRLDTAEMAEFTDRCIRWAAVELQMVIPSPNEIL